MSIRSTNPVGLALLQAVLLAGLIIGATGSVSARDRVAPGVACWKRPAPETLEEAFMTSGKNRARQAQAEQRPAANAVLLLSNGLLKVAYSAGLIVGWGETGERPRFAAITAVGTSALIAPFAFIGSAGDQAIADIFNCSADSLDALAENAASFLDEGVLAAIAREHDAGRRLFVALPGSAIRPETIWDIGLISKSRDPAALALAKDILRASTGKRMSVEPSAALKETMQIAPPNPAFRHPGTGREFLPPARFKLLADGRMRYFLIHNDSLYWDESADYIASRKSSPARDDSAPALLPGSDIVQRAVAARASFRFASPKTAGGLTPQSEFDRTYLKGLFHHAFRQARMDKEWGPEFPGLKLGASGLGER
jgi:hypothetical protein